MYFDLRWLPPELRHLLVGEVILVVILIVAVCYWGARSRRRIERSQTTSVRLPRTRGKKRGRR